MANSALSPTSTLVLLLNCNCRLVLGTKLVSIQIRQSLQRLRSPVQRQMLATEARWCGVDSCLGVASSSSIFLRLGFVPEREPQPWLSEQHIQPVLSSVYFCCYLVSSLVLLFFVREFNTSQSTPSVSGYWRLRVHFVVFISLKPSGWQP